MPSDRLEALKSLVSQKPDDLFARYGLAMEYAKTGDWESALAEFRTLLERNPDYVAAYYQGGQALERLNRLEEAGGMYRQGIEAATRTGNLHARGEMQAALDVLGV
ncbi:MAG: tetratricopeptide repeat protein [Bryobacterales bacterium]|nr:tetratricopeptide repeat protein [Bryobacterales bacterium]